MTYSLVDSLSFIDSQDYRYRMINRCINDLSHGRLSHGCSYKYCPHCRKQERVILGHSSCVTIVNIISLSSGNLGCIDYTAPVHLFMTGIVDLDTHSSLLLIEELLKTATSGEEYIRNNVYN